MRKRNILTSPRVTELKRKKRKVLIRNAVIFSVGFLAIVALLAYLSSFRALNFSKLEVSGNRIIDTEAVEKEVQNVTGSKYLWLFPKTNVFLYPKSTIQKDLADKFKRLQNITLEIKKGNTLEISVTERVPQYTWCGDLPTGNDIETCYFLDNSGYIFDEAPYFSGEVYFKFYGALPQKSGGPPGNYFYKEYFEKLIAFKEALEALHLKPAVLYMEDGEDGTIFLSRTKRSLAPPEIRFRKAADLSKVADDFGAALATEPLKTKFEKEYSSLQYFDLRFDNKVYYKFAGQRAPALGS